MQRAKLVQPEDEVSGELLFSAAAVYFVGNSDGDTEGAVGSSETGSPRSSASEVGKPLVSLSWKMSALREVHRRWYQVSGRHSEGFQACISCFAPSKTITKIRKFLLPFCCWFLDGSRRGLDCHLNEGRAEAEAQYGKRECDIVVVEGDGFVDAAEKNIDSVEVTAASKVCR